MREYEIGQHVFYRPTNGFKLGGQYVVVRLVPQPNGEQQYIIRSPDEPFREYTAEVKELRSAN
jgi:hypothetical protein